MAADECLLHSAAVGGVCSLRLYSWSSPTVSLGYFQPAADRLKVAGLENLPVVRRASGGGAIVHHHEITYCYAFPNCGDASKYYSIFHESLRDALAEHGLPTRLHGVAEDPKQKPFLCFQRRSPFDLVCGPHKIAGSAQRKLHSAVAQHGSLIWRASSHAPSLLGVADLDSPLRRTPPGELIQNWLDKLAERLSLVWHIAELSGQEQSRAREIAETKYDSHGWLNRR